jgi:hypothetical protein
MTTRTPQVLLFDNSALNHLFGQLPQIDEPTRAVVIERLRASGTRGETIFLLTESLLGEVAGLFFSRADRFALIARFLFQTCEWRFLRPARDEKERTGPGRFAMELHHRGRAPWDAVTFPRRRARWFADAFLGPKRSILDKLAIDAATRKKKYAAGERERRAQAIQELAEHTQKWDAEFAGWETDPSTVVDEWTAFAMQKHHRFYGLPSDRSRWPKPRDFVTLWYARAYHVARLREVLGDGRKCDDGADLYDGMYFDDAAYADVLVTGDQTLQRRAESLRLARPRVVLTEAWVAELLSR